MTEGARVHMFGEALSTFEQHWLAARINEHIKVCAVGGHELPDLVSS